MDSMKRAETIYPFQYLIRLSVYPLNPPFLTSIPTMLL
uniref:Uncharacterized protein n=1 Tax=Aeromonas salmonicida subsp. salmonicida TaxID=29491 RepID=A0A1I9S203_AERSS|nr:putative hypothetical protein [Aeromonas salmonicida subsp. salmonicida]